MASPALCRAPPKYSRHRQMKKKQGRPGPASARPRPRHRRPPVLRSPRQRCHHHHTPGALLGPPPPHLGSSVGSLGRHVSREGVAAPRSDLRPPPPRPERGGREPPGHGQSRSRRSRVEEEAATAAPGEEGRAWGGGQPACGRIRCRTAPCHCCRALERRGRAAAFWGRRPDTAPRHGRRRPAMDPAPPRLPPPTE
jgi:hypothetical protein